jgi:hypothetical protein
LTNPLHASSFTLNANGTFTYVHDGSTATSDSFTYQVDDGNGGAAAATVTLTITPRAPSAWQNRANNNDVNNDTFTTPQDALIVINDLNNRGPRQLPPPTANNAPPPFYDVNGDGSITPQDALVIINFLNERSNGEGEGFDRADATLPTSADDAFLALPDYTVDSTAAYGRALLRQVLDAEEGELTKSLPGDLVSQYRAASSPRILQDRLFSGDWSDDAFALDEDLDIELDSLVDGETNDSALAELFDDESLFSDLSS